MKTLLLLGLLLFTTTVGLLAHDHLDVRLDPVNGNRLTAAGNFNQTSTYFPLGQSPSSSLYAFPGGAYASELTFSAFDNTSPPSLGARVRVDLLSVTGPAGGTVSFWEEGATTPTWTRSTGWTASLTDHPSLFASEDDSGYGHIHGRAFTTNKAGSYEATFQLVDELGHYPTSLPIIVRFTAIDPPALSLRVENNAIKLTFVGRPNLTYDVQSSTTLNPNEWTTIDTLDGVDTPAITTDPMNGRPRVFYRLVEY